MKSEVIKRYDINTIIKEDYKLPLGLDFEDVELVSLDLKSPSIIAARAPKDLDLINQVVLEGISQLKEQTTTILIDADGNMSDKEKYVRSYYTQPEELIYIKQGFNVEIKKRLQGQRDIKDKKIVIINNFKEFSTKTGITENDIRLMFAEGPKVNVYIIITSMYNDILGTFDKVTKLTKQIINQAIIVSRLYDQEFLPAKSTNREPLLKPYEMYYFNDNEYQKIRLLE